MLDLIQVSDVASLFLSSQNINPLELTVSDLFNFDTDSWNWNKIQVLQLPAAAVDFLQVLHLIPSEVDKWCWIDSQTGLYTVKNGYKYLFDIQNPRITEYTDIPSNIWQILWKQNYLQPKIQLF